MSESTAEMMMTGVYVSTGVRLSPRPVATFQYPEHALTWAGDVYAGRVRMDGVRVIVSGDGRVRLGSRVARDDAAPESRLAPAPSSPEPPAEPMHAPPPLMAARARGRPPEETDQEIADRVVAWLKQQPSAATGESERVSSIEPMESRRPRVALACHRDGRLVVIPGGAGVSAMVRLSLKPRSAEDEMVAAALRILGGAAVGEKVLIKVLAGHSGDRSKRLRACWLKKRPAGVEMSCLGVPGRKGLGNAWVAWRTR